MNVKGREEFCAQKFKYKWFRLVSFHDFIQKNAHPERVLEAIQNIRKEK